MPKNLPKPDFLSSFLSSNEGRTYMDRALEWFSEAAFRLDTKINFADWSAVIKDAERAFGADGRKHASAVAKALGAWVPDPRNPDLIKAVVQTIDKMTTALTGNIALGEDAKAGQRFQDAHFAAMATLARMRDDAARSWVENIDVGLSNIRLATVCDSYVEKFGAPPDDARIGKDERASDYWAAWLPKVAFSGVPLSSAKRILENLKVIEDAGNSFDDKRKVAVDQIVSDMQVLCGGDAFSDLHDRGRAAVVLAETMRSEKVLPGGAYRSDQPGPGLLVRAKSKDVPDALVSKMDDQIKRTKEAREKRDRHDDRHPESGRVRGR